MKNCSKNLTERIRDPKRILLSLPLLREKLSGKPHDLTVQNIELQLTGSVTCNVHCWYCSTRRWGSGKNQTRSFFEIANLKKLKIFHPRAIVLSGGEPTLYQPNKQFGFNEAIKTIANDLPRTKFGLLTNGTAIPKGNWMNYFEWIRISLDAGRSDVYFKIKGVDYYNQVLANFSRYLATSIPYVGLGFVYQKENIETIFDLVYQIYRQYFGSSQNRITIQFRPIIYYADHLPTMPQLSKLKQKLEAVNNNKFQYFCANNTNIDSLFTFFKKRAKPNFKHCYLCRVHKAINSNGDIFPCCLSFKNKQYCLGNLKHNSISEIIQKETEFFLKSPCRRDCRLNRKNEYLETKINRQEKIDPSQFICPYFF